MNRKKLLLLLLFVVLLLALLYAYLASPGSRRTAAERSTRAPRINSATPETQDRMVKLELLDRETEPFKGIQRDLFGDLFPPPKVVKPPPPPPKPVVKPPMPVQVKRPSPVEVVRRDLARFTFMGYLRKQESWTIFLSSDNEIFLVQEGDRFGRNDQFHAVEISPEQLVIEQATQGRIVIPLVEKQPLIPSSLPAAPDAGSGMNASPSSATAPSVSPAMPGGGSRPFRSNPFGGSRTLPKGAVVPENPAPQMMSPSKEVTDE